MFKEGREASFGGRLLALPEFAKTDTLLVLLVSAVLREA